MAYQNVGTPRFYIDYLSYWATMGFIKKVWIKPEFDDIAEIEGSFIGLNPSDPCIIRQTSETENGETNSLSIAIQLYNSIPTNVVNTINYVGFLGHNLNKPTDNGLGMSFRVDYHKKHPTWNFPIEGANDWAVAMSPNRVDGVSGEEASIINTNYNSTADMQGEFTSIDNQGFSLTKVGHNSPETYEPDAFALLLRCYGSLTPIDDHFTGVYTGEWNLNSFIMGNYYDMPHSPDLKLELEIDNDGFDASTTKGGSHLTNVRYSGPAKWEINGEQTPPYMIGEPNNFIRRNGRRVWKLSFSYLSDKDLFASNYMSTHYAETGSTSNYNSEDIDTVDGVENQFYYTLGDDNSFIARVLQFVGNGTRFLFQPSKDNSQADQFAICQLDQDSLDIKQVANGVYSISLKIREVW